MIRHALLLLLFCATASAGELEQLIADLGRIDANRRLTAAKKLAAMGEPARVALEHLLRPAWASSAPRTSNKRVDALIAQWSSRRWPEREKASLELRKIGEPARAALLVAVRSSDPEVSWRAKDVLRFLDKSKTGPKLSALLRALGKGARRGVVYRLASMAATDEKARVAIADTARDQHEKLASGAISVLVTLKNQTARVRKKKPRRLAPVEAALILGQIGKRESIPSLWHALCFGDKPLRAAAEHALFLIAGGRVGPSAPRALREVLQAASESIRAEVRKAETQKLAVARESGAYAKTALEYSDHGLLTPSSRGRPRHARGSQRYSEKRDGARLTRTLQSHTEVRDSVQFGWSSRDLKLDLTQPAKPALTLDGRRPSQVALLPLGNLLVSARPETIARLLLRTTILGGGKLLLQADVRRADRHLLVFAAMDEGLEQRLAISVRAVGSDGALTRYDLTGTVWCHGADNTGRLALFGRWTERWDTR